MPQTIKHPTLGEIEFPDSMTDDQIVSAIKQLESGQNQPKAAPAAPSPVAPSVSPGATRLAQQTAYGPYSAITGGQAIAKRIAKENPQFTNSSLSSMAREMGTEAGLAAAGQTIGALIPPIAPVAIPTFGGIGGLAGNLVNQYLRDGPKGIKAGEAVSAFIAGALPGGNAIKAAGGVVKKAVVPLVADAGAALAAAEAQSVIDRGHALEAGEAATVIGAALAGSRFASKMDDGAAVAAINAARSAQNEVEKGSEKAIRAGFKLWPSSTDNNSVRIGMERLGDTKKTQFALMDHNLNVIDKGVRDDLQMYARQADGAMVPLPITKEAIELKRNDYESAFNRIGAITGTKAEVNAVRDLRRSAAYNFKKANAALDPDAADQFYAKALALSNESKAAEKVVEEAAALKSPALYDEFVKTRKMFAQSFAVEDALDAGGSRSGIDPMKLFRWQSKRDGQELTDHLGTIAQLGKNYPDIVAGPSKLYAMQADLRNRQRGIIGLATSPLSAPVRAALLSNAAQGLYHGPQTRYQQQGFMASLAGRAPRSVGTYLSQQQDQQAP